MRVISICFLVFQAVTLTQSLQGVDLPLDDDLRIPDQPGFEQLKIEGINEVRLYDRYPDSWVVNDLTGKWQKQMLTPEEQQQIEQKLCTAEKERQEEDTEKELLGVAEDKPNQWHPDKLDERKLQKLTKELEDQAFDNAIPGVTGVETVPEEVEENDMPSCFATTVNMDVPVDPDTLSIRLFFEFTPKCDLFVNSVEVDRLKGGWHACDVDLSRFVKQGKNEIKVITRSRAGFSSECQLVVGPPVYVKSLLLNPDTSSNMLGCDLTLVNNRSGMYVTELTATITPCLGEGEAAKTVMPVRLQSGEINLEWNIHVKDPVYWTPDNPFLYEITFNDSAGNTLGKERFGFRDFGCDGKYFYLNGKRIFLYGMQWNSMNGRQRNSSFIAPLRHGEHHSTFAKRYHYGYLKGLKKAGVNSIRVHADTGRRGRALFETCDEIGILNYDDWQVWRQHLEKKSDDPVQHMKNESERMKKWLYYVYNHPSTVMFSFGNEQYKARPENMNVLYDNTKALDKQNRPICSSTGRIRIQLNRKWHDKTDFADDHNYWGTLGGSWRYNKAYIESLKNDIDAMYGSDQKPLVNFECIAISPGHAYANPELAAEMNQLVSAEQIDKKRYVKIMRKPDKYGWQQITRRAIGAEGMLTRYTDEVETHKMCAELFGRFIELYRQQDILQGIGPHQASEYLVYAAGYNSALKNVQKRIPDGKFKSFGIDPSMKSFIWTPALHEMKRCYNPEFISARWFDRNLIAGSGVVETDIHFTKDTNEKHSYAARVLLRDSADRVIDGKTIDFGKADGFIRRKQPYSFALPGDLPAGDYRLELYLFRDGKRVSDNSYEICVFPPEIMTPDIKTSIRVAVYYGSDQKASALNRSIFNAMGFPHSVITEFSRIDEYDVLIIGSKAIDETIIESGLKIEQWIKNGGRLLAFEQRREGPLPWLSRMKIERAPRGWCSEFADVVDPSHPAMTGLEKRHFDTWNGNGLLFRRVLGPPMESAVALGAAGYVHEPTYGRTVLADISSGNGLVVLNQFEVTGRYGHDGVATILANNLVRHILSGQGCFSYTLDGRRSVAVNPATCAYIDLSTYANSGFKHDTAQESEDGLGDLLGDVESGGGVDLTGIPVGRQMLAGVPFRILSSGDGDAKTCVRLDTLEDEVKDIQVNAVFKKVLFLHTISGCSAVKNSTVYRFTINYSDGRHEKFNIKIGVHTSSPPHMDDLPESFLGWACSAGEMNRVGVYVTEWNNPYPDKEIRSINFSRMAQGSPVLIAVTGCMDVD